MAPQNNQGAGFNTADCRQHAGMENRGNRGPMDAIMVTLPANQSGMGRHKCTYCAYLAGRNDALAELGQELLAKSGRGSA